MLHGNEQIENHKIALPYLAEVVAVINQRAPRKER
jgi:hypothetical protein